MVAMVDEQIQRALRDGGDGQFGSSAGRGAGHRIHFAKMTDVTKRATLRDTPQLKISNIIAS